MVWNWQLEEWPNFTCNRDHLSAQEARFLEQTGILIGTSSHLSENDQVDLSVSIMVVEALDTSSIEGEILDRESVQSSIQRALGLKTPRRNHRPAENGIAEMMVDLLKTSKEPLSHEMLYRWHAMMMNGRRDLDQIGAYRTHDDPMQIISGAAYAPKVHYEAPPSKSVLKEMAAFIKWFNKTAPTGKNPLPSVERAGIAHLWFECIHPFEDGNGRIGRAISEKALTQGRRKPVFTSLAGVLLYHRKEYYQQLELASRTLDVNRWLKWFSDIVLDAQARSQKQVEFLLAKTRLFDRLRDQLNERQEKILLRMFAEGIEGFKGGLSAKNYMTITDAPTATTTRDLADLVKKGALTRQGMRKATRYYLNLEKVD
ncbi:MAG: Fic family protein [Alphaproteobacteria bacterium]|nr:Fic family protein [Alphaproteobacteria bacterium]